MLNMIWPHVRSMAQLRRVARAAQRARPRWAQPRPILPTSCDALKTCLSTAILPVFWLYWACLGPKFRDRDPHTEPHLRPNVWTQFTSSWAQVGANWPEFGASYAQVEPKLARVLPNLGGAHSTRRAATRIRKQVTGLKHTFLLSWVSLLVSLCGNNWERHGGGTSPWKRSWKSSRVSCANHIHRDGNPFNASWHTGTPCHPVGTQDPGSPARSVQARAELEKVSAGWRLHLLLPIQ